MKALGVVLLLFTAAAAQVTVSPLFPLSAAVPDLPLLALLMLAVFGGRKPVMYGLPVLAICLGFVSAHAPGLLIIAYLPLLPLATLFDDWQLPLGRYVRVAVGGVAAGLWLRLVLSFAAVVQGADFSFGALLGQVLFPGVILDLALLTVAYVPLRFIGWSGRTMGMQGGGAWSSY